MSSDGGSYWLLCGSDWYTTPYDVLRQKAYNPTDGWYIVPAYSRYGGRSIGLSRSGHVGAIVGREDGMFYNNNYLDEASWNAGRSYASWSSRIFAFANDDSCWCLGDVYSSASDYVYWNNDLTFSTTNREYITSAAWARSYAFKGKKIGAVDYVHNKTYGATNGTSLSEVYSYDAFVATDDDNSFTFVVNADTGAAVINSNSLSNTKTNGVYVSRDGEVCMYLNTSDNKLYKTTNKGSSWSDVTPSSSSFTNYIRQQWNTSI